MTRCRIEIHHYYYNGKIIFADAINSRHTECTKAPKCDCRNKKNEVKRRQQKKKRKEKCNKHIQLEIEIVCLVKFDVSDDDMRVMLMVLLT